jgi:hypothetical protein
MKNSVLILGIVILLVGGVFVALRLMTPEDTWVCQDGQWVKHGNPLAAQPSSQCGTMQNANTAKTNEATANNMPKDDLSYPHISATNKFGWLDAGLSGDDVKYIREAGGGWIRPHPGAALWDAVQTVKDGEYDFSKMDEEVSYVEKNGINLLATIWPFAEWDQLNRADASNCAVSSSDEFLQSSNKKGRPSYLPLHRCNPNDWAAYQAFVTALVERYDGDGTDDMPGLLYPVKHWEVMNEPDLTDMGDGRLDFYKQDAPAYGELLVKTYSAIKSVDSEANVLIAGAAGGDDNFLGFYTEVFSNIPDAKNSFDIGNVHCISNDPGNLNFNVGAYKLMLTDAGLTKPIWVTEAEQMDGQTFDENVERTAASVKNAVANGAEKFFFTRYDFGDTRTDMSQPYESTEESTNKSVRAYNTIINSNK